MEVSIVAIGDELLIGQVVDTNSGSLARIMAPYGWEVDHVEVVGDNAGDIIDAIERAMKKNRVVLVTGGLGPTADDITKPTLCKMFGGGLRFDETTLLNVKEVMNARGRELNKLTEAQAMVPENATVIQNRVGTAPILWFEKNNSVCVCMPGVPFETIEMFESEVFPRLRQKFNNRMSVTHLTLVIAGLSESALATHLADFEASLPPELHLAYLPQPGIIRLRLDGHSDNSSHLGEIVKIYGDRLRKLTSRWMICDSDLTPAQILIDHLRAHNLKVSTAESCTGGNIAHQITLVPGASKVMSGGIVAYSNEVKIEVLGVDKTFIDRDGAVSISVVEAMAEGVCRATGSDMGIATSGIAGPGGGTPQKPVGTVCVAVALNGKIKSTTLHLSGTRERIIDRATSEALLMAISFI